MARFSGFAGLAGTMVATAVLADSADAVVVCEPAWRVLAWNSAAEQIFGRSATEALGRPATEVLEAAVPYEAATPSRSGVTHTMVSLRRGGGTTFRAHLTCAGVFAATGERVAVLTVIRPLAGHNTRPETAEAPSAGRDARRIAEVCHDMRQPLATIQYLLQGGPDYGQDSPIHAHLNEVSKQVDYLTDLTEQLLSEYAVFREPMDVVALLHTVLATVHGELVKDSARVELVTPEQLIISADGVALRRAVVNLVENAIRAAGPTGQVRISAARRPGMVEVDVEDSGPGLSVVGRSEASSEHSLGLFITDQVVRAHGGHLTVGTSGHLGGAAFRMLLPTPQT